MNILVKRSRSRLMFFAVLAILASAVISFLLYLHSSQIIDLMTLIYVSVATVIAMLGIIAIYTLFEVKRKTRGVLRF